MHCRNLLIVSALLALILAAPIFGQDGVYLDHVDGEFSPGQLEAGPPIVFHIRYTVGSSGVRGFCNGFHLYSPDGAQWDDPYIDTVFGAIPFDYGLLSFIILPGPGRDTVGACASSFFDPLLPAGFDDVLFRITTSVPEESIGKTLCLDSAFMPPSGSWMWSFTIGGVAPTWDGPHCYEIALCCENRGNFDGIIGPSGPWDVNDLTYLVAYLFAGGPPPPCLAEGNFDGIIGPAGPIDVSDLTHYVQWLFAGGPPPPPC